MEETYGVAGRAAGNSMLDFIAIVAKWRRFILWFVFLATVGAGTIAGLSPKWYMSSATVFPAEQTNLFSGLEGISSVARSLGVGGAFRSLAGRDEVDRFMAILKSESALMRVIEKFDLSNVYEISAYVREKTMGALLANTEFEIGDEGQLTISVYDKDPIRAAEMANYFVEVLNEINSRMSVQNATANRTFIERRLERNRLDLKTAEESLAEYQQRKGILIAADPDASSISAVAELYASKAKKEVEIGVLERTVEKGHPLLQQTLIELSEINKLVDKLPQTGMEGLRLFRELAIQQRIMEFLLPLYEQARVEEQRNTPSVVILDTAEVAERKAKPKISLYMLIGMVVSSLIALIVIFLAEGIERIKSLDPGRFEGIVQSLRSDWLGILWMRRKK